MIYRGRALTALCLNLKGVEMGRQKKTFSQAELKRANSAGFHCKSYSEMAAYLNVTRRTLFNWLKHEVFAEAVQAGKRRRERSGLRKMGFDPDETENTFSKMDMALAEMSDNDDWFKPLEPEDGYEIQYTRVENEDGSVHECWKKVFTGLPSLKELTKGMRRKNGRYIF
jgi:hypothetical protein